MKHFFCLLIFCVHSFFILKASEEIAPGSNKPPVTQANLSGIPNACVAGKVNAVTGDFVQYDIDFAIPTANPLLFERTYSSSFAKYGSLSLGCNLNHFTNLLINSDGDNHFKVRLNEGQGALTEFRGKYPYTPIIPP
ncbi:MAG: hypothetical protein CK425_10580 [Parachlamydia sp.]|nr:MAG: hypothetical protein CK425_10580 [Parachlamydia sp.]